MVASPSNSDVSNGDTLNGDTWNRDLIGVDPRSEMLSVGIVAGEDVAASLGGLVAEFKDWGWQVSLLRGTVTAAGLRAVASEQDVVLFYGTRGSRGARRALCRHLPTVAVILPDRRRGPFALLPEAGRRRTTSVVVVHRDGDANVLRRISPAALVRLDHPAAAVDLGAVLLRAHAWWR